MSEYVHGMEWTGVVCGMEKEDGKEKDVGDVGRMVTVSSSVHLEPAMF